MKLGKLGTVALTHKELIVQVNIPRTVGPLGHSPPCQPHFQSMKLVENEGLEETGDEMAHTGMPSGSPFLP